MKLIKDHPKIGFIFSIKQNEVNIEQYQLVMEELGPNLLVKDFTPQKRILSHPKLLLFVTHCGGNSMLEITYFGVPYLGIPLDAD